MHNALTLQFPTFYTYCSNIRRGPTVRGPCKLVAASSLTHSRCPASASDESDDTARIDEGEEEWRTHHRGRPYVNRRASLPPSTPISLVRYTTLSLPPSLLSGNKAVEGKDLHPAPSFPFLPSGQKDVPKSCSAHVPSTKKKLQQTSGATTVRYVWRYPRSTLVASLTLQYSFIT